jgi:hypothetical protein
MFNNHLYVLVQEKDEASQRLQYYFDKQTAMKAVVRHVINTKNAVKIHVFVPDVDKDEPLKLHKQIKMKKGNNGHYNFWVKFAFLEYSKDDVIEQPEMFFDTFEEVDTCK